jgi:hypothetical protein
MLNKIVIALFRIYGALCPTGLREKLSPLLGKFFPMAAKAVCHVRRSRLDVLNIQIVDHCNLNCKYCNNFSSIAKEKCMDKATFTKDLTRLRELTGGKIGAIGLMGGEPLLHPFLIELMKTTRALFPKTKLSILTNGILLTKQDEAFWETCHVTKTAIMVSSYPINIHYDEIKSSAKKHGVVFLGGEKLENADNWSKFSFDLEGKQNVKENFYNCGYANHCIEVYEGKMSTCAVVNSIFRFNEYFNKNIPVTEKDFIDIYKAKSIDEILDFLVQPPPICAYCNVNGRNATVKWGISKKDISEWVM